MPLRTGDYRISDRSSHRAKGQGIPGVQGTVTPGFQHGKDVRRPYIEN